MKLGKAEIFSVVITVLFMISAAAVTFNNESSNSVTASFRSIEYSKTTNTSGQDNLQDQALININIASESELCTLPGIGEVLAGRIIQYRTERGQFKSTDEIMEVSGIGVSKYEKIKDCITVTQTGG